MKPRLLKNTLITNASTSLLCGLGMAIFPTETASIMGSLPPWVYQAIGVGLVLFAADVYLVALQRTINPTFAGLICWADIMWVTASLGIVVFAPELFSTEGTTLILLIGMMVGVFAFLQRQGLKQVRSPSATPAPMG